jgi:hypothetical protein
MQNFGKIKDVLNTILVESIGKDGHNDKALYREYLKALRENEILKTQFMVYTNIENKVDENKFKASQYVKENIALLDKFNKKDILEANRNLAVLVMFEQIEDYEYELSELHENISNLIFTKKNVKTIDTIVESTSNVVDYITTNTPKVINEELGLPNTLLVSVVTDKFNEKYEDLSEDEKKVLNVIVESTDEDKEELFTTYVRECVDLIDVKLDESNTDEKDKLLKVKDKLLRMEFVSESFVTDISKVVGLKKDLK